MANNGMGASACNKLVEWIDLNSLNCNLEQINLEGNKLSDLILEDIVQALLKTQAPLNSFNVSKNCL